MNETPIHPPLPLGLGTYVTLTGVAGAVAAFIVAWVQNGMSSTTASLGVAALGAIAVWFAGRSHQAATAIAVAQAVGADLGISVGAPTDDPVFPVTPDVGQTPDAAPS